MTKGFFQKIIKILLAFVFLFGLGLGFDKLTSAQAPGFSLQLHKGWNQISSPVGTIKATALKGCNIIDGPYYWNGSQFVRSLEIKPMQGYWVKTREKCTLYFPSGPAQTTAESSLRLHKGWNMLSSSKSWQEIKGDCQLKGLSPGLFKNLFHWNGIFYEVIDTAKPLNDKKGYYVQVKEFCTIGEVGLLEFDFNLLVEPSSATVSIGDSVSINVIARLTSGQPENVWLGIYQTLPPGVTAFPQTWQCEPTCEKTLTFSASQNARPGTYEITIFGEGGGMDKRITYALTVKGAYECTSGPCCENGQYRPASYVCNQQYDSGYGCRYGTGCGQDAWSWHKVRFCSSQTPICDGAISDKIWDKIADDCTLEERCVEKEPACKYDQSCITISDGCERYKNNGCGQGTVKDTRTGLCWQKDGNATNSRYGWAEHQDAVNYCNNLNLGDHSDWRLPTIRELLSIRLINVDTSGAEPHICEPPFINNRSEYWSFTRDMSCPSKDWHWEGDLWSAEIWGSPDHDDNFVRCVRKNPQNGIVPDNRSATEFINNGCGQGTIKDKLTGLCWQKDGSASSGQEGDMSWKEADQYCRDLRLAGSSGWRLPNVWELNSLIDYADFHDNQVVSEPPFDMPAADPDFCLDALIGGPFPFYWTSNVESDAFAGFFSGPFAAWGLSINVGDMHILASNWERALCVKGQWVY